MPGKLAIIDIFHYRQANTSISFSACAIGVWRNASHNRIVINSSVVFICGKFLIQILWSLLLTVNRLSFQFYGQLSPYSSSLRTVLRVRGLSYLQGRRVGELFINHSAVSRETDKERFIADMSNLITEATANPLTLNTVSKVILYTTVITSYHHDIPSRHTITTTVLYL